MIWLFQRFTKGILACNFDIGEYEEVGGRKNKKINLRGGGGNKKYMVASLFIIFFSSLVQFVVIIRIKLMKMYVTLDFKYAMLSQLISCSYSQFDSCYQYVVRKYFQAFVQS